MRSKSVKFDISPIKRSFYAACNSIFSHSHCVNEMALLALHESYNLSVLLYTLPALSLTRKQINELKMYAGMALFVEFLGTINGNLLHH